MRDREGRLHSGSCEVGALERIDSVRSSGMGVGVGRAFQRQVVCPLSRKEKKREKRREDIVAPLDQIYSQ